MNLRKHCSEISWCKVKAGTSHDHVSREHLIQLQVLKLISYRGIGKRDMEAKWNLSRVLTQRSSWRVEQPWESAHAQLMHLSPAPALAGLDVVRRSMLPDEIKTCSSRLSLSGSASFWPKDGALSDQIRVQGTCYGSIETEKGVHAPSTSTLSASSNPCHKFDMVLQGWHIRECMEWWQIQPLGLASNPVRTGRWQIP